MPVGRLTRRSRNQTGEKAEESELPIFNTEERLYPLRTQRMKLNVWAMRITMILYQFRLISALGIRSFADRLNDSWIKSGFLPSVNRRQPQSVIVGIGPIGPVVTPKIMPQVLHWV